MATAVPSPDPVWSAEFPAKTSCHPTRGSKTALGSHCYHSSKPLREQRATRGTPAGSGSRGGAGPGLRRHKDTQETGMERLH